MLLLAVGLCAPAQSIDCANQATAETRARIGPGGVAAVLIVHSEDDHGKNTHDCMANYTLRIALPDGSDGAAGLIPPAGFTASSGEWGRRLSIHLGGFSKDGKHIFGVISEGGRYPFVQVFDFGRDGAHTEIQVKNGVARLKAARCGRSFAVAGTDAQREPVLEPDTENPCRRGHRWALDQAGNLRDVRKNEAVVGLYNPQVP